MKKLTLALAATLALATPAFAAEQTEAQLRAQADVLETKADVKADAGAVAKDNAAIAKHQAAKAQHQANHAVNKAAGNDMAAAGDSVKAAGSHVAVKAKQVEKSVDQKIMQGNQEDHADALNKKANADAQAGVAATADGNVGDAD